jgi:hypothetical protein
MFKRILHIWTCRMRGRQHHETRSSPSAGKMGVCPHCRHNRHFDLVDRREQ